MAHRPPIYRPNHDGSFISEGPAVAAQAPERAEPARGDGRESPDLFIPVDGANYCIRYRAVAADADVALHTLADGRPLLKLPLWPELSAVPGGAARGPDAHEGPRIRPDQRVLFLAGAGRLVTLAADNRRVVVRKLDVVAELEKSGSDYLFVASAPVCRAEAGKPYVYALDVKSRRGGVTFALEQGPEGMTVSDGGQIRWDVPAAPPRVADVKVAVTDAAGLRAEQAFRLSTGP